MFCVSAEVCLQHLRCREVSLSPPGLGVGRAVLLTVFSPSVLVLVFVVYNRRREAQIKYPGPEDDVRENIINYEDEGGGEDDMTAFDITPLQIPIADPSLAHHSLPRQKVHCK